MLDEVKLNYRYFNKTTSILSHKDILILPFEGQSLKQKVKKEPVTKKSAPKNTQHRPKQEAQRKQASKPSGVLRTTNIGIRDTINPPQKKHQKQEGDKAAENQNEKFSFEDLERTWKSYALALKRERKDSLYTTLVNAILSMTSDFRIKFEIHSVQAAELEREKVALMAYLRKELKNYSIQLEYSTIEQEKVQILDSKGTFDKLLEENSSLDKLRKLFNLDIEF